jgi:hypothetical protein
LKFTKDEHKNKAIENEQFADSLPPTTCGIEWAITVNFYAAVHYVSAYFALANQTCMSHGSRAIAIKKDAVLCAVYDEYQNLYNISRDARYEVMELKPGHLIYAKNMLETIKKVICPKL